MRDDHEMRSHFHPACFSLPKKTINGKSTDDEILQWLSTAEGYDEISQEQVQSVLGAIKNGLANDPKVRAAAMKRKYEEMKAQVEEDEANGTSSSKKPRGDMLAMECFMKYNAMKTTQLKEFLTWNRQTKTGTKDLLVEKCKDGELNGAIPPCPTCSSKHTSNATTLKIDPKNGGYICGGWYDKENSFRVSCKFLAGASELTRDPWALSAALSREVAKVEEISDAGKSLIPNEPFPIPIGTSNRDAAIMIYQRALAEGIALPKDEQEAKQKCGTTYMCHDSRDGATGEADGRAILIELATQYRTVAANLDAKVQRASGCRNPKNASMLECFAEIARLMKEEGQEAYKMKAYYTVISFLETCEEEVTDPIKYSKKKTKVAGIGKGTAEKMKEFLDTGTIAKLETLRGSGASGSSSSSSSSNSGATSY